jgi:hypothetical protein
LLDEIDARSRIEPPLSQNFLEEINHVRVATTA